MNYKLFLLLLFPLLFQFTATSWRWTSLPLVPSILTASWATLVTKDNNWYNDNVYTVSTLETCTHWVEPLPAIPPRIPMKLVLANQHFGKPRICADLQHWCKLPQGGDLTNLKMEIYGHIPIERLKLCLFCQNNASVHGHERGFVVPHLRSLKFVWWWGERSTWLGEIPPDKIVRSFWFSWSYLERRHTHTEKAEVCNRTGR